MIKKKVGIVVTDKLEKTINIVVRRRSKHLKYLKYFTKSKKYLVHDKINQGKLGDIVLVEECRPISKLKHCILKSIIQNKEFTF